MDRLPRVSGNEMLRFLEIQGFVVKRIRGSHYFLESGKERTCVPVHGSKPLRIGTLRSILRDIKISPEEFAERLSS